MNELGQEIVEDTAFWTRHQEAVRAWLREHWVDGADPDDMAERAAIEFDWLGAGIGLGIYLYVALEMEEAYSALAVADTDRDEQVNWLRQLASDLAGNCWQGTADEKVTFWEERVKSGGGSPLPKWYDCHDHQVVVRFMEAQE